MAAYADHAMILGKESEEVYAFIHESLDMLARPQAAPAQELLAMSLRCGEMNLKVMGLWTRPTPAPTATPCRQWCESRRWRARRSSFPAMT